MSDARIGERDDPDPYRRPRAAESAMDSQTEPEELRQLLFERPQQQQQADGEEPAPSAAGPAGSPRSVLRRLQTRFQQSSEDLWMTQEQNSELERRITTLTEQVLASNEEKEALKAEHRGALSRLEEAALAERRRYESALCSARQQQQRGQMDRQLATDELTALRGQMKTLQMDKVGLARQVRDLETEVKARCRLQQNASDQMMRYNQTKNKLNKEVAGLVEWLKRLEAESRSAAELNGRLQLLLQHQSLQLEQLAPPAAAAASGTATCPELEQLKALLADGRKRSGGGGGDGLSPPPPPPEPAAPPPPDSDSTEAQPRSAAPSRDCYRSETDLDARQAAEAGEETALPGVDAGCDDDLAGSEAVNPLLLAVPQLRRRAQDHCMGNQG